MSNQKPITDKDVSKVNAAINSGLVFSFSAAATGFIGAVAALTQPAELPTMIQVSFGLVSAGIMAAGAIGSSHLLKERDKFKSNPKFYVYEKNMR